MSSPEQRTEEQFTYVWHDLKPFVMPDENSCMPTVARAVIRTYEGISAVPDPAEIDAALGREPGSMVWGRLDLTYLAERGYEVAEINAFDMERWAQEGVAYEEEYFGINGEQPLINAADFKEQTKDPIAVKAKRENALAYYRRLEATGRYVRESSVPTAADVLQLLGSFGLVTFAFSEKEDRSTIHNHLMVAYGYDDNDGLPAFELFAPNRDPSARSTGFMYRHDFERNLLGYMGVAAIRPSEAMNLAYSRVIRPLPEQVVE